ncbi:hypothetical protein SNE40_017286 [Patella caerulea]
MDRMCTDPNFLQRISIGQMLPSHKIQSFIAPGLMVCARECVYQTNCLSFNFDTESGQCELTRAEAGLSLPLVSKPGFVYATKSDWITAIAANCQHVKCPPNHRCVPELNGTHCVLNDCGIPPTIKFAADVDYTETIVGAKLGYNCSRPGMKPQNKTMTCTPYGSWDVEPCRKISSCADVQRCNVTDDREYWLYPEAFGYANKVKIYCHGMNTLNPKEYVSLPSENLVVYPSAVVKYSYCGVDYSANVPKAGKVHFEKVRVHPKNMTIDGEDNQFANLRWGKFQAYGRAVDCASYISCRKYFGFFRIDTTGTGLVINRTVSWVLHGNRAGQTYFNRSSDHVITAKCGGYCGGCFPDSQLSFELEAETSTVVQSASDTMCSDIF